MQSAPGPHAWSKRSVLLDSIALQSKHRFEIARNLHRQLLIQSRIAKDNFAVQYDKIYLVSTNGDDPVRDRRHSLKEKVDLILDVFHSSIPPLFCTIRIYRLATLYYTILSNICQSTYHNIDYFTIFWYNIYIN